MANKISKFVCMLMLSVIGLVTFLVSYNNDISNRIDSYSCEQTKTVSVYSARPELIKIGNILYYVPNKTVDITITTTNTTTDTPTTTSSTTTIRTTTNKPMPIPDSTKLTTSTTKSVTTTTTVKTTETTTSTEKCVYIVYKPSTHYIHKSTCKWFDKTCKQITDTHGLECRRCSNCNPDMVIEKEYVVPVKKTEPVSYNGVSQSDIILLQKLVANEYGADWVSTYEKAKIVAAIMNQVKDKRFPNTVRACIYNSCVPYGFNPNKKRTISQSVKDAVAYYFQHPEKFKGFTANSWYGDGKRNHFYTA